MRLIQGDCIEEMAKLIDEGVVVDMSFADLPYKETGNKWDRKHIDHKVMFDQLKQLVTDAGAMLFTGTFKFGTTLYNACPELYKYDWVWQKDNGTNVPMVNYQPFRVHEQIFVFGKGRVSNGKRTPMTYHPQKTQGKPYICARNERKSNWKGKLGATTTYNLSGLRHPLSVQFFKRDRGYHTTQKPVEMMEYLIKTYTDEGDTVLDFTMGSGTTGVACRNLNRDFIGIELDPHYYQVAHDRIYDGQERLV